MKSLVENWSKNDGKKAYGRPKAEMLDKLKNALFSNIKGRAERREC